MVAATDAGKLTTVGPKKIEVRLFVYCSTDTFEQLAKIGTRWSQCIAAQQSNLVNEAEALADAAQRRAPSDYMKHRVRWEVSNSMDADRLRMLIAVWPSLSRRQQEELVRKFEAAIGL